MSARTLTTVSLPRRRALRFFALSTGSQLADRIAALEAEKSLLQTENDRLKPAASSSSGQASPRPPASKVNTAPSDDADDAAATARLRLDLAEALRARGAFEARLKTAEDELVRLRAQTGGDATSIRDLSAERKMLTRRLRDRESELRDKGKLVAEVQDELAVLHLQLNMTEKKRAERETDYRQLVERYMKRVGREADELNDSSEPLFAVPK